MFPRIFASNFERTERLASELAALRTRKEDIQRQFEELKHQHQLLVDKYTASKGRLEHHVNRLMIENRRLHQELVELRFERAANSAVDQQQFDTNLLNRPPPACLPSADDSGVAVLPDQPVHSTMVNRSPVRAKPPKRPCNAANSGTSPNPKPKRTRLNPFGKQIQTHFIIGLLFVRRTDQLIAGRAFIRIALHFVRICRSVRRRFFLGDISIGGRFVANVVDGGIGLQFSSKRTVSLVQSVDLKAESAAGSTALHAGRILVVGQQKLIFCWCDRRFGFLII